MVTLETDLDRSVEVKVLHRLLPLHEPGVLYVKTSDYAAIDYVVTRHRVIETVEIKTRKEPHWSVQKYGGLMLKQRKAEEVATIGRLLNVPASIVFAFDNGDGAVFQIEAERALTLPGHKPPERRNYRGLACDEEPVVYLDWERDLERILDPVDK